jgi:hypothetical protein
VAKATGPLLKAITDAAMVVITAVLRNKNLFDFEALFENNIFSS